MITVKDKGTPKETFITSLQNEKVKALLKLHERKGRKESGLVIMEGEKFIWDAVQQGSVVEVYVSESFKNPPKNAVVLNDAVFKKVSTMVTAQGILAVVKTRELECDIMPTGDFLVLDRVQDPANVGALFRTAAAAGFKEIYLIDSADPLSPKAVQASAGCVFKIKHRIIVADEIACKQGIVLAAADFKGMPISSFKRQKGKMYGLVIGNEGQGVSRELRARCNEVLTIAMNNEVESLNAAVAGAIVMYKIKGLV